MRFDAVLVANRGEIARRIMRTARSMGYRCIAVFSEADSDALHVREADAAVCIGPAPASESYLDIESVIDAARHSGASAIHPGYGFLSENADFARACEDAGIAFVGPGADAIALMGNKAAAKRRMEEVGVPCVPGYHGDDQSDTALKAAAEEIGYPVMVKAAAGGGGRGMRVVESAGQIGNALRAARAEAESAFGSGQLILERAIARPRHVEVQILSDGRGNTIHLGERDCSVQRRHQKIIEESPCPVMTAELRAAMGAAAVDAANGIDYRGAGTVEFLLGDDGAFFFMEMNTRLQVEHPVTEAVTGLDLVALQLKIAEGERLAIEQQDVRLAGHAIEVRLYAEDAAAGFLPSSGRVDWLRLPKGDAIRVDAGIDTGDVISPYYDSMVAKIIAWGQDRETALRRLNAALTDTALVGPATNRDFLLDAINRPGFVAGAATTAFVEEEFGERPADASDLSRSACVAAVLQHRALADRALAESAYVSPALRDWSSSGKLTSHFRYEAGGRSLAVAVRALSARRYEATIGDRIRAIEIRKPGESESRLVVDGDAISVLHWAADERHLFIAIGRHSSTWVNDLGRATGTREAVDGGLVQAPMHGSLAEVFVVVGDRVAVGDRLFMLETMKMQHEMTASVAGIVKAIHFEEASQVPVNALIMEVSPEDSERC